MISVVLPVYNGEKYLKQAIDSILNQGYKDFEIIIVNDGSTDNSENIIKKVKDSRIKCFYKENGGEASARNFAFEKCGGEYITFLDADDLMKEDRLEKQVEFLNKNPNIDAVYCNVDVIDENNLYVNTLKSEEQISDYKNYFPKMLYRQVIPATATLMLKRKIIDKGIRYPERYKNSVDYLFSLEIAKQFNIDYINESLYLYRRHNNNLTNNHQNQVKTEIDIVKRFGIDEIKKAVNESTLDEIEKKVLLAKILIKIEELEKALEILNEIKVKNKNIYFHMGNINFELENLKEAKKNYELAIKEDNTLAEVHNNLGIVNYKLGEKDKAKELFNKAIEINEIYMDAKYNLNETENFKITKRELRKTLTRYIYNIKKYE